MADAKPPIWRSLYFWVLIGIAAGIAVGWLWPTAGQSLEPLGLGFVKLVKMVIPPVIFLTIVTGIAGMADLKAFGRVGAKALGYFLAVSTLALAIGLAVANLVRPGEGLNVDPASLDTSGIAGFVTRAEEQDAIKFLLDIIPDTLVSAFTSGAILQVVFVSILFGVALAMLGEKGERLQGSLKTLTAIVFRIVHMLMYLAPLAAFGAMAFTIGKYGIGALANLAASGRDLLRDLVAVRDRRAGADRPRRRLLALGPGPLHQGRAAARARHLLVGKRAAAADGEARAGRLPEADRRPGRADRLFVQPRRHLHLHVAGRPVHRPGLQHPALGRGAALADGGGDRLVQGRRGRDRLGLRHARRDALGGADASRSPAWR